MQKQGYTKGRGRGSLVALFLLSIIVPNVVSAVPDIPTGTGSLPDMAAGAKIGAIVTAQRVAEYRKVLPAEIADLVVQGELAFEAVLNPATKGLVDLSTAPSSTPPQVDGKGNLLPPPVSVSGPLFSVDGGDDDRSARVRGFQALWNATTPLWRERSFAADLGVTIFKAGMSEFKRVDFAVERIYPPSLGISPGTLSPLFREKISGRAPQPIAGLTWLTLRFLGSSVEDYLWAASPVTGDVMQMTGSNRGDSVFTDAFSPDDLFVWSGKVEGVQPERVSQATLLVPMVEGVLSTASSTKAECSVTDLSKPTPVQINAITKRFASASPWVPTSVRFVPRSVVEVEGTSRDPYSKDARQLIYIDALSSVPVYRAVYGQDARLRKIVIGVLGSLPTEDGAHLAWRGQVIINAETGGRTVIALNRYERCSGFVPGRSLLDFDPSRIGSKQSAEKKRKEAATPAPVSDAEPVDE